MSILDRCESRDGLTVRLLAVHTTEGNGTAQQLRDAAWWTGSSHAINDEHGTLLTPAEGCVPYGLAAWTLRSGNRISENIEQVGWARWTRPEWLARPKLLDNTARWLAARSKARGIPLVKLTPAEVAAGKWGVIGHVDWTVGMKDGTHTDPGPNYPWDVVLDKARAYANGTAQEEDVPLTDVEINAIADRLANRVVGGTVTKPVHAWEAWRDAAKPTATAAVSVDAAALAAALASSQAFVQALAKAVNAAAAGGLTKADVKAAVSEFFADAAAAAQ